MPKSIRPKEIKLRLSLEEHAKLLEHADGQALAPWIRNIALGERRFGLSHVASKTDPALLRQIATIGNNLNQIARALNSQTLSPIDKIGYLADIQYIKEKVDSLAG